jgi:hypothetical protein
MKPESEILTGIKTNRRYEVRGTITRHVNNSLFCANSPDFLRTSCLINHTFSIMSSHHFVKEGQEPALLIMDAVSLSLIEPILEWAPQVMVYESALEQVLGWGIKIDIVVSKQDTSEALAQKLISQAPVKFLSGDPTNDVAAALHFLISTKQRAVSIVTDDAYELFDRLGAFLPQLGITLLTGAVKWSGISSGLYKKWLPAASRLLIYAPSEPELISGLKKSGSYYEVLHDGFVNLASGTPFWVGEGI